MRSSGTGRGGMLSGPFILKEGETMCGYHCPFAERKPCAGFLLCRDMYEEGVNYNVRANAMNVICAFQKQCMRTGRMENTDSARDCYEWRIKAMAEAKKAVIEDDSAVQPETAIDKPENAETTAKVSGKKKKKN